MIRQYLYPALAVALIGAVVGAFFYGRHVEHVADELDDMKQNIETRERIDDALDNSSECAWPDRLRGTCQ